MEKELQEGQIVRCKVEQITGTVIFVKIEEDGEGTITTSEIAPGRIRNIRDYVSIGKRIVCKVLSLKDNRVHLSLRRVTNSEKKQFLETAEKEKSLKAILKTITEKNSEEIIKKIEKESSLIEFFEQAKANPKILEEYFTKEQSEKIIKILESKKEKLKQIKQILKLSNKSSDGIKIIKEILINSCKCSKCKITYIAAGKYTLSICGGNYKELKTDLNKSIECIEKQAKKHNCEFELLKR